MTDNCFRLDEIPVLKGSEPHLEICEACRGLYHEYRGFHALLSSSLDAASPFLYTLRRERAVRSLMAELETLPPERRFEHVRQRGAFTPGLVAALSDRARDGLFRSPNEAEHWLDLGGAVLESLQDHPGLFLSRDIRWVEACLNANEVNLLCLRGFIREARTLALEIQDCFSHLGDPFRRAMVARGLAFIYTKMGQPREAVGPCLEALASFREHGARMEYLGLMNNLALIVAALGRPNRAEGILRRLQKALPPENEIQPLVAHNLALMAMEQGKLDKARSHIRRMLDLSLRHGFAVEAARAHLIMGELALLEGRSETALGPLAEAESIFADADNRLDLALLQIYRAKAYLGLDQPRNSLHALHAALEFFMREGYGPDLVEVLELWERAQKQQSPGIPQAAAAAFLHARRLQRLLPPLSTSQPN